MHQNGHVFVIDDLIARGWYYKKISDLPQNSDPSSSGVKSLDVEVTSGCDFACPHCWADAHAAPAMSLDVFQKALRFVSAADLSLVQFCGGEPTLNKDLFRMARLAKDGKFRTILRTHGFHMLKHEPHANASFAVLTAQLFDKVVVSLDGSAQDNFLTRPKRSYLTLIDRKAEEDEEGAKRLQSTLAQAQYEQTMRALQAVDLAATEIGSSIQIDINTVVTDKNKNGVVELAWQLEELVMSQKLRLHRWDISQVTALDGPDARSVYTSTISDQDFIGVLSAITEATPNIAKRAKFSAYARCLMASPAADLAFKPVHPGESKDDSMIGNLRNDSLASIKERFKGYIARHGLAMEREKRYIHFDPHL